MDGRPTLVGMACMDDEHVWCTAALNAFLEAAVASTSLLLP
jgi:hypothetical protein